MFKRVLDRPASRCWPFWIERYAEGELQLVCDLRAVGDGVQAKDYLVVFERAYGAKMLSSIPNSSRTEAKKEPIEQSRPRD